MQPLWVFQKVGCKNRFGSDDIFLNPNLNLMRNKHFFLLAIFLLTLQTFAQQPTREDSTGIPIIAQEFQPLEPHMYNPCKSKVPIWLDLSVGANYAECFDKGTIPFRYTGFGANVQGGVTIEWERCRVNVEGQGFYTSLTSVSGTAYNVSLSAEFLYHCAIVKRFSFWAGGTLQGFMDNKEIPALMNASSSISLFGNLCATGLVEYPFAYIHEGMYNLRNLLTAYAKLSLPLVGAVNRPGFAYIGNPTINNDDWLEGSETFAKFFSGAATELGLFLNLPNDNRIGLAYRWNYLSTGKKGTYRYDNALHSLNLSFMFRIN